MAYEFTEEQTARHGEMLANRVKKNYQHFKKRYAKQNIECFRLYDWDIPEIRAAVDWYAGHLVVAEYVRTQTGEAWLPAVADAVGKAMQVAPEKIHLKRREAGADDEPRYTRLGEANRRFQVSERDLKLWVNLDDFIDTGLFSDHRDTREKVRAEVKGKRFLNLFAYTGAFTCAAAAASAHTTVTVDRSLTNLDWAKDNMKLNGFTGEEHFYRQANVMGFLKWAAEEKESWDVVVVDPPSFYEDKLSGILFDISADHPELLQSVLDVTEKGGVIYFSTNHQGFVPDFGKLPITDLKELTPASLPEDYRNRLFHRCWRMRSSGRK